jgi:hypothetical protein
MIHTRKTMKAKKKCNTKRRNQRKEEPQSKRHDFKRRVLFLSETGFLTSFLHQESSSCVFVADFSSESMVFFSG